MDACLLVLLVLTVWYDGAGPQMVSRALHCKAAEAPLSYAQEQMWALYELDQGSAAYSCPAVQWLRGQMHAEILVAAVEQLGSVQQSLRSRYGYSADQSAAIQWVPQVVVYI